MASGDEQRLIDKKAAGKALFPISMAVANYDRTRALLDGRVKPEGIALDAVARYVGEFCLEPVYEQYDTAEMSFSWYVMARCRGEPVMALPIFPLRMPVFAYVFVRSDSSCFTPRDLIGKRIGVGSYRFTVNLWLRGIFAEHYGVTPQDVTWVSCAEGNDAGYDLPAGIEVVIAEGTNPEELLARGEVDAIFATKLPAGYVKGDTSIRHLLRDAQAESHDYFRRTGLLPITHAIAIKQSLTTETPWVPESLTKAFMESQRLADSSGETDPKYLSLFDAPFYQRANRAAYGANSWRHGVGPNRKNLETFLRYAHEQGYTPRRLSVEELFPANTLGL